MDYANIYKKAYEAFLKAAINTNDSYKLLSWFGKNKSALQASESKKAA